MGGLHHRAVPIAVPVAAVDEVMSGMDDRALDDEELSQTLEDAIAGLLSGGTLTD